MGDAQSHDLLDMYAECHRCGEEILFSDLALLAPTRQDEDEDAVSSPVQISSMLCRQWTRLVNRVVLTSVLIQNVCPRVRKETGLYVFACLTSV